MALSTDSEAHLQVDHDNVIVTAPGLVTDRSARLFFNAIIGASPTQNGWRCPRRNLSVLTLVVRVNSFLENRGLTVRRVGLADEAIQREIERKRSFERARQAALALREGAPSLNVDAVKRALHDSGWSEANRNLYPHQEIGLMHGLTVVNAANFSVPGAGKTATTLAVAMTHIANATVDVRSSCRPSLMLCALGKGNSCCTGWRACHRPGPWRSGSTARDLPRSATASHSFDELRDGRGGQGRAYRSVPQIQGYAGR